MVVHIMKNKNDCFNQFVVGEKPIQVRRYHSANLAFYHGVCHLPHMDKDAQDSRAVASSTHSASEAAASAAGCYGNQRPGRVMG